ncbi:MAG: glycosyltransferase family 1 protein [Parcubacteria group bacterium]|jgi:glycosyltransferase involved in cell wall biosynthesis
MTIGIDASRAFQKNKTGIEEYSYQVIKHLRDHLGNDQVILYCNPAINKKEFIDFDLPEKWKIKYLRAPFFWTQIRLSLEMLFHPVDALFVPAHTVPSAHPENTAVTIHGLEYEFCPKSYSFLEKAYMRFVIKNSCKWAKKIITVSENTKRDLGRLYEVPEKKMTVIYEGINSEASDKISNPKFKNSKYEIPDRKYFFFVGRLEERKNICGLIEAFDILKNKYKVPHKLVLAGKFGYGEKEIRNKIESSRHKKEIILPGYVFNKEKFWLMGNADAFLFPTLYEGFGLPILEAQSAGTPVVTSNISSMPEVAGDSAVLVDPKNPNEIAEAAYRLISNESYKNDIIKKGYDNIKRFSWEKCAENIADTINNT